MERMKEKCYKENWNHQWLSFPNEFCLHIILSPPVWVYNMDIENGKEFK